jgi:hypothetical protein
MKRFIYLLCSMMGILTPQLVKQTKPHFIQVLDQFSYRQTPIIDFMEKAVVQQ